MRRAVAAMTAAAAMTAGLAGCATVPTRYPVQATRFHFDPVAERGAVLVEPLDMSRPSSIEYGSYAAAVHAELNRVGFSDPQPGAPSAYRASVAFTRTEQPLAPRRSPISIGLGAGGSSGGYRGGGVGLGGGISFPIGGGRARIGTVTELSVRILRGPDSVWEGQARTLTDPSTPEGSPDTVARRLAAALFSGFPGESGRTVEVR